MRSIPAYAAAAICLFLGGAALSWTLIQLLRHRRQSQDPGQALVRLVHELPLGAVLRLGQNILMNDRASLIVGCPRGRLRTLDQWFAYLYGPQAAEMRTVYERDRAMGLEDNRKLLVNGSDGVVRNVQMTVHNVGNVELWLLEDVTAKEESAGVRRSAQQRMQQCLSNMAAMAFVLDRDGTVLLWEGRAMDILGFRPGEASGQNALSVYRDDLAFVETLRRALTGEEFTTVIEIRGNAFEVRYTALRGSGGKLTGTIGVAIDVNDRRRAERALAESERRYRLLYNSLSEIMAVHQMVWGATGEPEDYRLLDCNEALCRLLKRPREQIIGRLATEVYGTRQAPFIDIYAQVVKTGKRQQMQQYFAPLQKYFAIDVFLPGTGADQFATLATDITEEKLAEEVLAGQRQTAIASNRAKDRFLTALSRDLRLPLTPVLALLSSLEHDDRVTEALRQDMRMMRENVENEVRLLDNLVDTVQVLKGKLTLEKVPVDLNAQIKGACDAVAGDYHAKQVKLDVQLAEERCHVAGNADRLQQAFWNLLRNALDFTPPGGEVQVRSHYDADRHIVIEVIDNGEGMDSASLLHVFDPLSRAPQHSDEITGAGFSLPVAKALVEVHGGEIAALSEGAGKGSTLRVTLPPLDVASPLPRPPSPAAAMQKMQPRYILLVEDDADTLDVLSRLLQQMGHVVSIAATVKEAAAQLSARRFDVLIADIGMPDGSGLALLTMPGVQKPTRAVALSGRAMETDVAATHAAGFQQHLTKPLSYTELRAAVSS